MLPSGVPKFKIFANAIPTFIYFPFLSNTYCLEIALDASRVTKV
jgi:hypothetical protein